MGIKKLLHDYKIYVIVINCMFLPCERLVSMESYKRTMIKKEDNSLKNRIKTKVELGHFSFQGKPIYTLGIINYMAKFLHLIWWKLLASHLIRD